MYRGSKAMARVRCLACVLGLLALPAGTLPADVNSGAGGAEVAALIGELGLREGRVAARDMPGWNGLRKVVVRLDSADRLPALQAAAPGADIVMVQSVEAAVAMGLGTYENLIEVFSSDSAIKRPNRVEEVAAVAVLLASDVAAGITGTMFPVDGGSMQY